MIHCLLGEGGGLSSATACITSSSRYKARKAPQSRDAGGSISADLSGDQNGPTLQTADPNLRLQTVICLHKDTKYLRLNKTSFLDF